jgi:Flp pilus assembly protein TadG
MLVKSFFRKEDGVQAIEFAIIGPILIVLLLGLVDVGRLIYAHQKVAKATYTLADISSRAAVIDNATLTQFNGITQDNLSPFNSAGTNNVSITAINQITGSPTIAWNWRSNCSSTPKIGTTGAPNLNTLGDGTFALKDNEGVFVVEVWYNYTPIFLPSTLAKYFNSVLTGAGQVDVRQQFVVKPRKSGLITAVITPPC